MDTSSRCLDGEVEDRETQSWSLALPFQSPSESSTAPSVLYRIDPLRHPFLPLKNGPETTLIGT